MSAEVVTGSLYELSEQISLGMEVIEAAETIEEREAATLAIQPVFEAILRKADSYAQYITQLEAVSELAANEIKRLQARKKAADSRLEWMLDNALRIMKAKGWKELKGDTSTLTIQGCSKSLSITDESKIPDKYRVIVPQSSEVDKAAVKIALKSNIEVPGAELIGGEIVRVK